MRALLLALLVGCDEVPETPCEQVGDPRVEVVPADLPFGAFVDGDDLPYGTPPQGGAPYTALRLRVSGLTDLNLGVSLALTGTDVDDASLLGEVRYDTRLVCANVGDSAGSWLASDVHFRYFGWELADLADRMARIAVSVRDPDGTEVTTELVGALIETP